MVDHNIEVDLNLQHVCPLTYHLEDLPLCKIIHSVIHEIDKTLVQREHFDTVKYIFLKQNYFKQLDVTFDAFQDEAENDVISISLTI